MDRRTDADAGRSTRLAALTMTAVGATVLGAIITIGPAAGLAQADADPAVAAVCGTGAVIVVPGTFDPLGAEMSRSWDRPDLDGRRQILVEYPATLWPLGMVGYDRDVELGVAAARTAVQDYRADCPDQPIEIIGWSQGARIAGDVLSDIGNGRIDGVGPENVSGLLYSDPRQDGTVTGRGIELSMIGVLPGLTMTGAREGGFGAVSDSVITVCAERDGVCDLPDPLHDPIGVLDGLIGYATRHQVYPAVMDRPVGTETATGTWLDELECTDRDSHGTVCLHQPGSALSGVVRDTAAAIGLPGEKLPDLLVLRPRVPGAILPGVHLAGVQRPVATIFALLPDLPNLTHHTGGHLPDLFAFTDVFEGVVTLDEGRFRAGTTALGESAVSIVRIPRNQVRHLYVLAAEAWAEREAARAAIDGETGSDTTAEETEQIPGPETVATTASSAPVLAVPADAEQSQIAAQDQVGAPTTGTSGTPTPETASQAPSAAAPSPEPQEPATSTPEQTPTSESGMAPTVTETDTEPAPTRSAGAGLAED